MTEIVVEPQNPLDLNPDELGDLARSLQSLGDDYEVRIAYWESRGVGVTWWEVLHVWVPWSDIADKAVGVAVGAVLGEAIRWAKARFKKEPKRPKYIAIYGSEGKVLRSIRVTSPEGEPEDLTEEDRQKPPRTRPPAE